MDVFTPKCDPSIRMSQQKASSIQSSISLPLFFAVLIHIFCSLLTGAAVGVVFCCCCSSAPRFQPVLNTLLWRVVIFSRCCLPFRLKQPGHSLQTSGINKPFLLRELPLTGCFLFFGPFSVNPRNGPVGKSLEISSNWNNKAEISGVSY